VLGFAVPLTSLYQTVQKCWAKNHFAEPNWHAFDFTSSNFNLQDDILSTGGVVWLCLAQEI
jgi:hypothetical protein